MYIILTEKAEAYRKDNKEYLVDSKKLIAQTHIGRFLNMDVSNF